MSDSVNRSMDMLLTYAVAGLVLISAIWLRLRVNQPQRVLGSSVGEEELKRIIMRQLREGDRPDV